jgi:cardiolipin synthase (CMP-forming)
LRQLPHLLTLARLVCSPLIAWLILHARFREALAVTVFAGLTDWFDGFAARRLGATGGLGAILDPLADKLLLLTLFLALAIAGLISTLLLFLVLGRDLVIVLGALLIRLFRIVRQFLPSTL